MIYGILGKLKIRRKQFHGGSIPPPGTKYPVYLQLFASREATWREFVRYKYGTVRILFILNNLRSLMRLRPFSSLRPVEIRLRSITECAADNLSACETLPPRVWIQAGYSIAIGKGIALVLRLAEFTAPVREG